MRDKHRNISGDSFFHPGNVNPQQYLKNDKILEKPGRIDLKGIDTSGIPLAGKLGEIGKLIINDPKHVSYWTTGPWDVEYHDHVPRAVHGKTIKPLTDKSVNIDMQSLLKLADNFSAIHRKVPSQMAVASPEPKLTAR